LSSFKAHDEELSGIVLTGLSVLVVLVPSLVVLAVCLPVLADIAREGCDRHRQWKAGEIEPYTEDTEYDAGPPAVLVADGGDRPAEWTTCPFCGTANDCEFAVCRHCARWL